MRCAVFVRMGYDKLRFEFEDEQSATQFAVVCHDRLAREIDDEGKPKKASVTVKFQYDDCEEED